MRGGARSVSRSVSSDGSAPATSSRSDSTGMARRSWPSTRLGGPPVPRSSGRTRAPPVRRASSRQGPACAAGASPACRQRSGWSGRSRQPRRPHPGISQPGTGSRSGSPEPRRRAWSTASRSRTSRLSTRPESRAARFRHRSRQAPSSVRSRPSPRPRWGCGQGFPWSPGSSMPGRASTALAWSARATRWIRVGRRAGSGCTGIGRWMSPGRSRRSLRSPGCSRSAVRWRRPAAPSTGSGSTSCAARRRPRP